MSFLFDESIAVETFDCLHRDCGVECAWSPRGRRSGPGVMLCGAVQSLGLNNWIRHENVGKHYYTWTICWEHQHPTTAATVTSWYVKSTLVVNMSGKVDLLKTLEGTTTLLMWLWPVRMVSWWKLTRWSLLGRTGIITSTPPTSTLMTSTPTSSSHSHFIAYLEWSGGLEGVCGCGVLHTRYLSQTPQTASV